ncbi:MAG TPA: hypothetical protein DEG71_06120, partial [Clostridiales bacterium]|nr:hypothetical protein [Clostridiales bacterium]
NIIWQTATDNNPSQISIEHEYILCYAKSLIHQNKWSIESEKAYKINKKYIELKKRYKDDLNKIQDEFRAF